MHFGSFTCKQWPAKGCLWLQGAPYSMPTSVLSSVFSVLMQSSAEGRVVCVRVASGVWSAWGVLCVCVCVLCCVLCCERVWFELSTVMYMPL